MKKNLKKLFLLAVVVITAMVCLAFSASAMESWGDYKYLILENGTVSIKGYTGNETELVIPSQINDKKVTEIGSYAFECKNFKSVTIPEGVEAIREEAFLHCKMLEYVLLPDSLKQIGGAAFLGCESLETITIPKNVISLYYEAFFGCTNLKSVIMGNRVIRIAEGSFVKCPNLKDVYYVGTQEQWNSINIIPGNGDLLNATIHFGYSYDNCTHENKVNYPQQNPTCMKAGYTAGTYCSDCKIWIDGHITIPRAGHIDKNADKYCDYCNSYTVKQVDYGACGEDVIYRKYEDGTLIISGTGPMFDYQASGFGESPFAGSDIKKIIIEEGITSIGRFAFSKCKNLLIVIIPDSVKTIYDYAFAFCEKLEIVISGNGLEMISENAFLDCDNIKDLYYKGSEKQWSEIKIGKFNESLINANHFFDYVFGSLIRTTEIIANQTTSVINLEWSEVPDAMGYRIYQMTANGWKNLGVVSRLNATIKNLKAGTKYTFAVKAGKIDNGSIIWSKYYTEIKTVTKAFAPAKIISAQNTTAIRLAWSKCPGATGYRIYYKSGANWKIAVSATANTTHTFTGLKSGSKFTFAVRPYIITDSGVVWSDYTTFIASTLPATVTSKVSSPSKGKLTLNWNAVAGADGYQVYYKTGNGSYKLYYTYTTPQNLTFSGLKSGTKYTFAVRAGIKTSDGVVWGGYKEASVTVK